MYKVMKPNRAVKKNKTKQNKNITAILQVNMVTYLIIVDVIGFTMAITVAMWVAIRKGMMTECISWRLARTY